MNRPILVLVGLALLLCASSSAAGAQENRILLAVFAHPDDEVFVSPILARYAREGADVHLVLATRGDKWAPETDLEPGDEIAELRAGEARCSAAALGINPPILLPFGDGSLGQVRVREAPPWETLAQLENRLADILEELRPDVVVTWGPEGGYGHPDHRLVGAVLTQMVQRRAEGAPHLLYVGLPSERWPAEGFGLGMPWQPTASEHLTVRVAYTDADFEATRRAFACHESQFPPMVLQAIPRRLHEMVWQGQVSFRPWFRAVRSDDLFALPSHEGT